MSQKIETPMTPTEKNEVIARFMGIPFIDGYWRFTKETAPIGCSYLWSFLQYDQEFNWLMPACQKFCMEASKLEGSRELIINIILRTEDFYFDRGTILDIHQALYEGIEWLNKQQNKEA